MRFVELGTIPWRIAKVRRFEVPGTISRKIAKVLRLSVVCEVNSRNFEAVKAKERGRRSQICVCEELGTVSRKTAKVQVCELISRKFFKQRPV